jgi:hypothetical protein
MRAYARCVTGLEDKWIGRMDQALHLGKAHDLGRVWGAEAVISRHPAACHV